MEIVRDVRSYGAVGNGNDADTSAIQQAIDACHAQGGGRSIPRDADDPNWRLYIAWTLQAYRELRQAICDAIHQHRPEVVVSFNWAYTQRQPEVVPESVGALMADVFPDDQAFNGSYLSRYWATLGADGRRADQVGGRSSQSARSPARVPFRASLQAVDGPVSPRQPLAG